MKLAPFGGKPITRISRIRVLLLPIVNANPYVKIIASSFQRCTFLSGSNKSRNRKLSSFLILNYDKIKNVDA